MYTRAPVRAWLRNRWLADLPGPSANLFTLVKVNEGDRLGWVRLGETQDELLLLTDQGMAIRFSAEEIRPMGLVAAGVMGIKLAGEAEVVGMELLPYPGEAVLVASDGSAKRVAIDQFPKQGRYGQGIVAWKLPPKIKAVGFTVGRGAKKIALLLNKPAPRQIRLDEVPLLGRSARGKSITELKAGEQVTGITFPWVLPGLEQTTEDERIHPKAKQNAIDSGQLEMKLPLPDRPMKKTLPAVKPSQLTDKKTPVVKKGASSKQEKLAAPTPLKLLDDSKLESNGSQRSRTRRVVSASGAAIAVPAKQKTTPAKANLSKDLEPKTRSSAKKAGLSETPVKSSKNRGTAETGVPSTKTSSTKSSPTVKKEPKTRSVASKNKKPSPTRSKTRVSSQKSTASSNKTTGTSKPPAPQRKSGSAEKNNSREGKTVKKLPDKKAGG